MTCAKDWRLTDEQQRLVEANLGLARLAAARVERRMTAVGKGRRWTFEELTSAATLGLIRAARGFDPSRGTRFSTYATACCMTAVGRILDRESRPVGLGYGRRDATGQLSDASARQIETRGGGDPADAVADAELTEARRRLARKLLRRLDPAGRRVARLVFIDGLGFKGAARVLGVSRQCVQQCWRIRLRRLRKAMAGEGVTCP